MKILNLKFKNINSLFGENEIDFTNPLFSNNGIFAITGKTGAGKTSILDAISLALYGKTPRVAITGSENEVMTKGEKDCFAEITFEVAGKKWKSSWKQVRTKNGSLSQINRVIADFDNKIIADKVSDCNSEIIKMIGLTFEQFTKVIMLAQGSFAAFLQADKNDKGELLEQITGTEVYGEISKNVFERNRVEQEKLKTVLLQLDAIKILSEEEIDLLTNENKLIEKDKKKLEDELKTIESSTKWLSDIMAFQLEIKEFKVKLPELEAKSRSAKDSCLKSENYFALVKEEQVKKEPIFKKVREIDTKISEKDKLMKPVLETIALFERSKNELFKKIESQKTVLEKTKNSLEDKQKWANENKRYEELVSNYAVIEKENQLLVVTLNEIQKLKSEVAESQKDLDKKIIEVSQATLVFNAKDKKLLEKRAEKDNKTTEYAKLLNGKELSTLLKEKDEVSRFCMQIHKLVDVENVIITSQKEMATFDQTIAECDKSKVVILKSIEIDIRARTSLNGTINLLEENIKLTKTIQSLEEHRHNLKDGVECPLCGAKEHPFALGNVPKLGESEKNLETLKKQFQDIENAINQNHTKVATLDLSSKSATENKMKESIRLSDNSSKKQELVSEIKNLNTSFSISNWFDTVERLNEILVKTNEKVSAINDLIKKLTIVEKELSTLRDIELPKLQEEQKQAEKSKHVTLTNKSLSEQRLKTSEEREKKTEAEYQIENDAFLKKLNKYDLENIKMLKISLDAWNENKKQTEDLNNQIAKISTDIALFDNDLVNQTNSSTLKGNEKETIVVEIEHLSKERKLLFEDKAVAEEESRLKKLIDDAELEKIISDKNMASVSTELDKNNAIVAEKEKGLFKKLEENVTDKTNQELIAEFEEKKMKADELSQKFGANNQTLKSNEDNIKTSGGKIREKEKQQAICNKWDKLNALIGSGDGKKYRNFAQGLTFDHLINLSNRQLNVMSDRYILKRTTDTINPFELSVVDKFQNNDERTTQNLSGGEKFIVSLSLALGLSKMASKNISIDTMFIDEGFGTLDTDYLDIALTALSNLQSEGKVIGVISHLTELKERIALHIEVSAIGNGRSKVQITN